MRRVITILMIVLLSTIVAQGQIKIGGNVYGGGNAGDTEGSTTVTIHAGDLNNVYGGARMANVGGSAFVNIDGEHATDNIFINTVYGGNDIAGTVGSDPNNTDPVPSALTEVGTTAGKNNIDNSWDAYIRTSPTPVTTPAANRLSLVIGSLFGGGNGEYFYRNEGNVHEIYETESDFTAEKQPIASNTTGFSEPEIGKTYLEILGGCIAHLYGGGNNATVTTNTTICINNNSPVLTETNVWPADPTSQAGLAQLAGLAQRTGLSTFQSDLSSYAFNFARIYGGNNKAPMAIRPVWNLQAGVIRDIYSGGNQGAMTSPNGILLEIQPLQSDKLVINNVFGGCRMADVNPAKVSIPAETINGTYYPAGYAARVLIEGGDINNVYGGNDISGNIYGGNAVGIHSSIKGDVYGGGNGAYAYTDILANKGTLQYGDFYYDPGSNSAAALNAFRPNAESVSIRVIGKKDETTGVITPTTIGGAIYCGGNCATLRNDDPTKNAAAELKIGSYVIADKVFLGNNGEKMVTDAMLAKYADNSFSSIDLTNSTEMDTYMDGVTMEIMPRVVFDDVGTYEPYSTYFGSFYCGGNVGSMRMNGAINLNFNDKVVVFDKVVGGSNEANVYASANNAQYLGGLLGNTDANGNKLILNFNGLKIEPKRWKKNANDEYVLDANGNRQLEWNTYVGDVKNAIDPATAETGTASADDRARRFKGGNIYGGCYSNGHVEGNVIINLNATIHERDKLFDVTDEGDINYENVEKADYTISTRKSGVILSEQGTDVYGEALNVFGGGYGGDSEIWGSTTINLNKGYTFQIFGGGEQGAIGRAVSHQPNAENPTIHDLTYEYDATNSTTINLNGTIAGVARGATGDSEDMAECEYIYGGGFEGLIAGDTHVNLNNGRIFDAFGGSCNADILGHTETYIGKNGFPYIRDYIYGGNDLGGIISGHGDFSDYFRDEAVKNMVYTPSLEQVKEITTYTEYIQGRVDYILGGGSGNYDYSDQAYQVGENKRITSKPYQHNTFVNFRPNANTNNMVNKIFGAGEGYPGDREGDKLQAHSYILIDIPEGNDIFANTEVFGAGANNGLGMGVPAANTFEDGFKLDEVSAIIDLARGTIGAAYGGSYEEGITRRTVVNVPAQSSININNIFGGAYGTQILPPCDVYESHVNYLNTSEKARVTGAVYGGNNNERRTLYAHVNISSPVWSNKGDGYTAKVYGAGKGIDTWSEYTEVNLESGANVHEVYGGGEMGHVLNAESVMKYMQLYKDTPSPQISTDDPKWNKSDKWTGGVVGSTLKDAATIAEWQEDWKAAWTFGDYYECQGNYTQYSSNPNMNLANSHGLVRPAEMDDRDLSSLTDAQKSWTYKRYNTNVIIHEGATVSGYAYGGGYGSTSDALSGDVYGTTYVALLGGTVGKDIYAAGTAGSVYDIFGVAAETKYKASANAYVKGGMVRNVFGGGWRGSVGYHNGLISNVANNASDILGETHVVIGDLNGTSFTNGIPAINRNVYGGGEGGGIFGTAFVTINNGRIGYRYTNSSYVEELDDAEAGDNLLDQSGNVFGGGYVANSYVDITDVKVYGGIIRGGLYGGGEVGPIGRGTVNADKPAHEGTFRNGAAKIYKGGETHVTMYKGHVMRDVFGGGRGYDNWGGDGYMTKEEEATMDLSSKGYVFGKTDVRILGGEVGTVDNIAKGYGNVFGGGNIGYVYSATGTKQEKTLGGDKTYYYYDTNNTLTNDCSVLITPYCQAKSALTIPNGGGTYQAGDFVPASDLDRLKKKTSADSELWEQLDLDGIIVRNAVFAGGNVSVGDNVVYANAKTVMGNVSANVVDIYNRDLITIGTEHVGGLYGDGNLTLVDGYRELNITNYGTDYYGMSDNISLEEYYKLTDRERAYFALEYRCKTAYSTYNVGDRITEDKYNELTTQDEKDHWEKWGFCSIYAGRLMNTIQRADFCGIFGSRMVLQGAKDRVPSVADKTDYTVNRVGEVSLNQVSTIAGESAEDVNYKHGNYFGIYSFVNYMGALTSDVNFYNTVRTTDNPSYPADNTTTFYQWKKANAKNRKRNNGKVANSVALASGVYLELTTEKSTPENKDWGYITGVAQLELINVKTGLGGGYVYAKNEHGTRSLSNNDRTILSPYNLATSSHAKAVTNKLYVYSIEDSGQEDVQTSGNFIHNVKQIIDDCYPTSNAYKGNNPAPAHYWFIRGTSYVYDQFITAYTGVSNAYSKTQRIPLNINAASNGRMKLEDVKENLYAYYYSTEVEVSERTKLQNTDPTADTYGILVNNNKTYHLNDSITYWDWLQLSEKDQRHFVKETYLTIAECKIGNTTYPEGTVLLPSEYTSLKANHPTVYHVAKGENVDFDFVFRPSNNLSHDLGYVVTYAVDNPTQWNTQTPDCTYSPNTTGVYGQRFYDVGEVIDKTTHDDYENMGEHKPADTNERKQAKMDVAYVTKEDVTFTDGNNTYNFIEGTVLCAKDYSETAWNSISSKVETARVCTSTLEFEGDNAPKSMVYGEVVTTARYNEIVNIYKNENNVSESDAKAAVDPLLSDAWLCYEAGYYGGGYFEDTGRYSALKAWSSLSAEDREHFTFNYDALNLLIDPDYSGNTPLYDNNVQNGRYSSVQPINYEAVYTGASTLTYTDNNGASKSIEPNAIIEREQYEAIPNEKNHYSPIAVENTTMYVVNAPFARGDTPYTTGQTITAETYGYLSNDQKSKVTELTFVEEDKGKTFYYCRESYTINATSGNPVKSIKGVTGTYAKGATVPIGAVIEGTSTTEGYSGYNNLTNLQTDFTIQGNSPEELTTLYVARQSDIFDLQKDRIITVIYSYDYTESDESGTHIEPISERHIINIHLHFESGVPEIATLNSPKAALPGDNVGLVKPAVKPGAYEIMGGGWELFPTEDDAMRHRNGREFTNKTPVYWYQDGQFLAYYTKTYLGKTYSNHVPMNVANYHDLKEVMTDLDHHMYVDHPDVKRASKIYINDYSEDAKSGLDLLKDLYDLSVGNTSNLTGHASLNERVSNMQNLEIFFHANTAPKAYANNWTPLANGENQCYNGTIHGEGYYIDGLKSSFIGHLCGHVYNLGVNGSFTSAGLADTGDGYVENCWVKTTGTPSSGVKAVFGDPTATNWVQVNNCYYAAPEGSDYQSGLAVRKDSRAFYNGEVAYDLNGYYLKERYNRQAAEADKINTYGYVENRYHNNNNDIDFLYSNGTIPTDDDPRLTTDAQGNYYYAPIWPDDYLFFGQTLTYGYQYPETGTHQAVPSHLTKAGTANTLNIVSSSNRVYRTPAYFGDKTMGIFHFNPYAVIAAKSADSQHEAYPGMTAVDFTAHNDQSYTKTENNGTFFAPVTDGLTTLTGVANPDETRNLLVYSPKQGTDMAGILTNYFGATEPEMAEKEDDESTGMKAEYRAVDALTSDELYGINGHLAYIDDNGSYWAHNHHVLVDKQDFNCPISYSLDNEHRMWYQRTPDNFVTMQAGSKQGWESVSIPFEAELVTTPDKGEITHFYGNSTKGHEYWLREFKGGSVSENIFVADFQKPAAGTEPKTYTNTFLWDYYYNYGQRKDANSDEYQNYYSTSHDHVGYPLSQAGTPYIVGFPGDYYYEFDLSGSFVPENTANWPYERNLDRQTITFASEAGVTIAVSDDELNEVKVSNCNYAFQPNYSSRELDGSAYVLNDEGSSYEKVATTTAAIPFRPYFTSATAGSRTRSIVFGEESTQFGGDEDMNQSHTGQNLIITARGHKIVVESQLRYATDVRIVNPAGITIKTFTIQPGEVIETFMVNQGVYIVQSANGRYTKKLAVR